MSTCPRNLGYRQSLLLAAQTQIALVDRDIAAAKEQGPPRASQADNLLDQTRLQLEQARATYTESHPTVVRLAQQVRELEAAARQRPADATSGGEPALDPLTEDKLKKLRAQRADLQKRVDDLEASIAQTSQTELGLSSLLREEAEAQRALRETTAKLAQAETGQRLEEDRRAERLEVIEQPIAARSPVRPNRPVILFLGLLVGAAAGIGPVAAWEVLDPAIKRERDLEKALGRRAIGLIPFVETKGQIRRRRRNRLLIVIGAIVFGAAALVAINHFIPLDAVWQRVLSKLT